MNLLKALKWGALTFLAVIVTAGVYLHFFSFSVEEDEMGVWPHPTLPIEAVVTRINSGGMSSYSYMLWIRSDDSKVLDDKAVILHTRDIEGTKIQWRTSAPEYQQLFIECVRPLVYDSKMTFRVGRQFFSVGMNTDCSNKYTYEWLNWPPNTPLNEIPTLLQQDPKLLEHLRPDGKATRSDYPLTALVEKSENTMRIDLLSVETRRPAQAASH